MDIVKWFDPKNKEHLSAYCHLKENGFWPNEFIPEKIEFPELWQVSIMWKMAMAWIDHVNSSSKASEGDAVESKIKKLQGMIDLQCSDGNWNYDPYMHGMANGMIFAMSVLNGKDPKYMTAPDKWLIEKEQPKGARATRPTPEAERKDFGGFPFGKRGTAPK